MPRAQFIVTCESVLKRSSVRIYLRVSRRSSRAPEANKKKEKILNERDNCCHIFEDDVNKKENSFQSDIVYFIQMKFVCLKMC